MIACPKVSVCLTTYQRPQGLTRSLESILAQDYSEFELIISDDHSSDETEQICKAYVARDKRVRYSRNASNLKMPGNLNAAISMARGEYIANLHDGDVYRPDLIAQWAAALDKYPTAAFVFNALEVLNADLSHRQYHLHPYPPLLPGSQLLDDMLNRWDSPVWGTVMARRSAYESAGPFDERFGFLSDIDMWMRLALRHDVAYLREPLISITPRESDHPYAFVSWELNSILEDLHRTNLERRYGSAPEELARALRVMRRRRDGYWIRCELLCLKHSRWSTFARGLQSFQSSDSPLLRAIGCLGWAFSTRPKKDSAQS